MTYSRPTLQKVELLPTEVRKDFLFLLSLSLLLYSLLQSVWDMGQVMQNGGGAFLGYIMC